MKIDKGCYERGCACAASNDVAGENGELVEVLRYRALSDEDIELLWEKYSPFDLTGAHRFVKAILKKAREE